MKINKILPVIITCIFLGFVAGFYLGRSNQDGQISTLVEQKSPLSGQIDLNTGTVADFCLIPGISDHTANKIITYREEYGPYHDVDDLLEIEGISKRKLEQIRKYLTVIDE